MNLKAIVRLYIKEDRPRAEAELDWFRRQPTLALAIENAALAVNSQGKRYSHQRRISRTTLEESMEILLKNEEKIRRCESFDALIKLIEAELEPVHGIGELYVYDTALRIAAKLDRLPTKVYLHAGTRVGARALGFDGNEQMLDVSSLPADLQSLEPYEIEDALCIYEDKLKHST